MLCDLIGRYDVGGRMRQRAGSLDHSWASWERHVRIRYQVRLVWASAPVCTTLCTVFEAGLWVWPANGRPIGGFNILIQTWHWFEHGSNLLMVQWVKNYSEQVIEPVVRWVKPITLTIFLTDLLKEPVHKSHSFTIQATFNTFKQIKTEEEVCLSAIATFYLHVFIYMWAELICSEFGSLIITCICEHNLRQLSSQTCNEEHL